MREFDRSGYSAILIRTAASMVLAASFFRAPAFAEEQKLQSAQTQAAQADPSKAQTAAPEPSSAAMAGAFLGPMMQQGMAQLQTVVGRGTYQGDMPDLLYHSPQFYNLPADTSSLMDTLSINYSMMDGNGKAKIFTASNDFFIMKGDFINSLIISGSYNESGTITLPVQTTARNYTVSEQLEWYFAPKWYSFAGAHWDSNEIAGFKADYGAKVGAGLFIAESKEFIARAEIGYDSSRVDRIEPFDDESLNFGMGGFRLAWMGERIFVTGSYKYFQDLADTAHQRHKVSAQMFIAITGNLFYVVGYDMWNDNKVPDGFEEINYLTTNALMLKF